MYIAIISHNMQAARLVLENVNTPKYNAKVSSRLFESISLSGYGGKVSSPNVV